MALLLCAWALLGCAPGDGGAGSGAGLAGDSAGDSGEDSAGGEDEVAFPCDGGSWEDHPDFGEWVHVRANGDDGGDGTRAAPFASVPAGLNWSRAYGRKTIFVGPGDFAANLDLADDLGEGGSDVRLRILGCGPDETHLTPASPSDILLKLSGVHDVQIIGVELFGGETPLLIWQGSSAFLQNVSVRNALTTGVWIDGNDTVVVAEQLIIEDTVAGDPDMSGAASDNGWGLRINLADVTLRTSAIARNRRAGIAMFGGTLHATDIVVIDTQPGDDDLDGEGIFADFSTLVVDGATCVRNRVAGVHVVDGTDTQLANVMVNTTLANEAGAYGDGILLHQSSTFDPAFFGHTLTDSIVSGNARAGVVVDGVSVTTLSGNTVTENGYDVGGVSIIAQGSAVMPEGSDVWAVPDPPLAVP